MIKKQVKYKGKVIFEKVIVNRFDRMPKANEEDEACVMFLDGGEFTIRSSNQILKINEQSMLVSKCMNYFFELPELDQSRSETVEAVGVMLYPSFISELYDLNLAKSSAQTAPNQKALDVNPLLSNFKMSISYLIDHPQLADEAMVELKLKELIILIMKQEQGSSINEFFLNLFDPVVYNLEQTIQQNLYTNLSIEQLAFLNNMSISTFKRRFKEVYGESPQKYITTKKIDKAKLLLETTRLPIAAIAEECGYDGSSSFNRNFKKKVEVSPSHYREKVS